ncbi:hypothetical protein ABKV19_026184 [Rosa sericea]
MADPEAALNVEHPEEEKSQRSVTEGGDTRTTGGWFSFNKIFNPKGKFLTMWTTYL